MGAVRQEHGHGCAGVCLSEADAGAGGAFFGGCVLCTAEAAASHAAEVGAGEACGASGTASATAEEAAEQVVNVDACAAVAEAAECVRAGVAGVAATAKAAASESAHARCAVAANLVVLFALLLVGEHVVCFRDFLELLLCCGVAGVQVRVVLAGELAVCLLDVAFACVFADTQCLIKVVG